MARPATNDNEMGIGARRRVGLRLHAVEHPHADTRALSKLDGAEPDRSPSLDHLPRLLLIDVRRRSMIRHFVLFLVRVSQCPRCRRRLVAAPADAPRAPGLAHGEGSRRYPLPLPEGDVLGTLALHQQGGHHRSRCAASLAPRRRSGGRVHRAARVHRACRDLVALFFGDTRRRSRRDVGAYAGDVFANDEVLPQPAATRGSGGRHLSRGPSPPPEHRADLGEREDLAGGTIRMVGHTEHGPPFFARASI